MENARKHGVSVKDAIEMLIPLEVPSQNVRERQHWSKQQRELKAWTRWFLYSKRPGGLDDATGKRCVAIIAYRTRRCSDQANLVGGCKGVIDALVRAKLLVDDSIEWMEASYTQDVASESPTKKPATRVVITEAPVAP